MSGRLKKQRAALKARVEALEARGVAIAVSGKSLKPASREYRRMLEQIASELSAEEFADLRAADAEKAGTRLRT